MTENWEKSRAKRLQREEGLTRRQALERVRAESDPAPTARSPLADTAKLRAAVRALLTYQPSGRAVLTRCSSEGDSRRFELVDGEVVESRDLDHGVDGLDEMVGVTADGQRVLIHHVRDEGCDQPFIVMSDEMDDFQDVIEVLGPDLGVAIRVYWADDCDDPDEEFFTGTRPTPVDWGEDIYSWGIRVPDGVLSVHGLLDDDERDEALRALSIMQNRGGLWTATDLARHLRNPFSHTPEADAYRQASRSLRFLRERGWISEWDMVQVDTDVLEDRYFVPAA